MNTDLISHVIDARLMTRARNVLNQLKLLILAHIIPSAVKRYGQATWF